MLANTALIFQIKKQIVEVVHVNAKGVGFHTLRLLNQDRRAGLRGLVDGADVGTVLSCCGRGRTAVGGVVDELDPLDLHLCRRVCRHVPAPGASVAPRVENDLAGVLGGLELDRGYELPVYEPAGRAWGPLICRISAFSS